MYMGADKLDKAQDCFVKGCNLEMFKAVLARRQVDAETEQKMKADFIEKLITSGMNEEAGDLIDPKADFNGAVECYLRGNCFEKAIKLCYSAQPSQLETHVRPSLLIAIDLKRNQLQAVLDTFGKRMLRLKVLQHSKRSMPVAAFGDAKNFELDSEQLSVSNASES